jgi:alkaline phosphatase D
MTIERRTLITAAGGLALFAGLADTRAWARTLGPKSLGAYPFTLGVASGDPAPDGFVIWTRLATKPLEHGGGMPMRAVPVGWEVAEDDGFTRIVAAGTRRWRGRSWATRSMSRSAG